MKNGGISSGKTCLSMEPQEDKKLKLLSDCETALNCSFSIIFLSNSFRMLLTVFASVGQLLFECLAEHVYSPA